MVYILGMSHAISVVDAFAGPQNPFHHKNWTNEGQAAFQQVPAASVHSPLQTIGCALLTPNFGPAFVPHDGPQNGQTRLAVNGRYVRLLQSMGQDPENLLVSMLYGNEHSMLSMIQHAIPFDFVLPWKDTLGVLAGRQIVPYSVVLQQMRNSLWRALAVFRAIRIVCPKLRVVHLFPPPPIPSEAQIIRSQEPFVAERFRQSYGITPVSIRLKYYFLYVRELVAALEPLKIRCVLPPREAVGPDGSLREQYWLEATHGNPAYGELVLQQIFALVKEKG